MFSQTRLNRTNFAGQELSVITELDYHIIVLTWTFQVVGAWAQTQEVTEEIESFRQKNQRRQRQRRSRRHHHIKQN